MIERLDELCDQADAHVVLSSTWRRGEDALRQIRRLLAARGFSRPRRIIGRTPVMPGHPRGEEIQAWLGRHPEVTSFVILDDDADMGPLMDRLVQTSFYHGGLQREHTERAYQLLRERRLA